MSENHVKRLPAVTIAKPLLRQPLLTPTSHLLLWDFRWVLLVEETEGKFLRRFLYIEKING